MHRSLLSPPPGAVFFQDYMPGNVCFGCGRLNPDGLQISSFWQEETALCVWMPQEKYHGWSNLLNGGILATLIDCHCMCTAMAAALKAEGRDLGSEPHYRFATGTINVRYHKPTYVDQPVLLQATVREIKSRKVTLFCQSWSADALTAEAEVIAIRVVDSSTQAHGNPFVS